MSAPEAMRGLSELINGLTRQHAQFSETIEQLRNPTRGAQITGAERFLPRASAPVKNKEKQQCKR